MAKTNYEKLLKINGKTHQIRSKFTTDLVAKANTLYNEQFRNSKAMRT